MSGTGFGIIAFALVAGSMALGFQRIQSVQIPEDRRLFVASWAAGGALGVFALSQSPGWIGGIPAGVAAFAGIFFTVLYFISPQKVAENAIRVGEPLRDFTATDENGDEFAISSTAGKPALLKFFRGHW